VIVAIDATPLTTSSGGVRRYTEELVRVLREEFPEDEYHLISDQTQPVRGLDRRWWTVGVQRAIRRLGSEVFHGVEFSVPYIPLRPSVLTLHDLSPWMNREWHHGADRVRRRTPHLIKLGIATMILTVTEAIRKQAIDFFQIDPSRIAAVHLAASAEFRRVEGPRRDYPYFLYVGVIEPRKNVTALLEAWRPVYMRHGVELVITGRLRSDAPQLAHEPGLSILGEVPNSDLPPLYSGAVACVYPSQYEGFGLPVLEAMQCGTPVITSRDPAVMEVSNGAAIHVDASDLSNAMEGLLRHEEERLRRREMSLKRAADFSWRSTARNTREVYVEAIRRFHG
jgi:glycosyltransferase involved in cell wall biosynthesis